jgi:hypothetical protein
MSARDERDILDWISPMTYGKHHISVKEARTPGTCEWLLQSEKFCEWWKAKSSAVLWLQGSSKCIDIVIAILSDADLFSWNWENIYHLQGY